MNPTANSPGTNHAAKAEHQSQGWVAVCADCRWMGADHKNPEPAAEEARMHRHSQRHPWSLEKIEPWTPAPAPSLMTKGHRPSRGWAR
jgi:hypothetical protein